MDIESAFDAALPNFRWGRSGGSAVWVLVADRCEWSPWRGQAMQLLDDQQRLRVARMRNLEARETLVIAYALHRMLVGRYLDMPAAVAPLWRDSLGCPRVGEGMAATSLSHAGPLVALAVGEFRPLGVDIEPSVRATGMQDLAGSICHPAERGAILCLPAPDRDAALLSLWVAKEAILKALGVGFSRGEMNQFSLPENGAAYIDREGQALSITRLYQNPDWVAAVACAPDDRVESSRITAPAV